MPKTANGTMLALDIGTQRTGVAIGQTRTQSTSPLCTLDTPYGRLDASRFARLIDEWQPDAVVIGDPNTSSDALNKAINRIKNHIQQHHKLPIFTVDETLTSAAANSQLSSMSINGKRRPELRDQLAACLILQSYFQQSLPPSPNTQ